ncbi:MAG TPA: sensor histidine kinase [Gammaproteobacteria bacterium]|nr:sensor histidine kinase [Gammaproteobacteria bacterium]
MLIYQAWSHLKWAAFHQYQQQAESLSRRIDNRFRELIATEEARSYTDYAFLVIAGDPAANFLQRSVLSAFPVKSDIPGLIGYFQVDAAGKFTTPLLPAEGVKVGAYGISADELKHRRTLQQQIMKLLSENQQLKPRQREEYSLDATVPSPALQSPGAGKVSGVSKGRSEVDAADDRDAAPLEIDAADAEKLEEQVVSQAVFDRLDNEMKREKRRDQSMRKKRASKLGRVEDLKLDYAYQQQTKSKDKLVSKPIAPSAPMRRSLRKESNILPEPRLSGEKESVTAASQPQLKQQLRIHAFESEIDSFEFNQLDSGHFVIFRKVWRDGARTIQGAVIDQQLFLRGVVQPLFSGSSISQMSDLILAYQGEVAVAFNSVQSRDYLSSAREMNGTLLYQSRLSRPLGEMQLIFSVTRMPPGPGSRLIAWISIILILILCGGLYLLYRMGVQQIDLSRQQQDFVSAVSHELKTPLTSIRMYGEMLREGWVSEEKRRSYYDYIHDESERLSRLITNVLQLARMTRNELRIELQSVVVSELLDSIRSRISSQVERAGFTMAIECTHAAGQSVIQIDPDSFSQIMINLVDNAIKFSADAERRHIEIGCQRHSDGSIHFSVRDFGPGIPRDQMKKIFRLFYRSESELTRETIGTGIGLALVKQLAGVMQGRVDVVNREPGAEFQVSFAACDPSNHHAGAS